VTAETTDTSFATTVVDAMEHTTGKFPGYRRAHARGVCFQGTFTPSGEAARLTTAAHLQSAAVPVTVRFSNSNGNPDVADGNRAGRGLAVRFHLPDGSDTDIISVNLPVFVASSPQNFLNLLGALEKDPVTGATNPAKLGAYLAANPEAVPGFGEVGKMPIPVSYGTARYWAIHAFNFVNAGQTQAIRYRWEPDLGLQELTEEEAGGKSAEYLTEELPKRLADGPVGFTLRIQLAEPGDPTNDATKAWPAERTELVAGRLEIVEPVEDQEHWAAQVFDPARITPGVELGDDPIPAFRSQAYSVSFGRRSQGE
jgi:catalase